MLSLDHLAVAGHDLSEATEQVEAALGVALQPGGRHDHFGTWNRLLGLADGLYLEVITIDPEAADPDRPRWFDLDRFAGSTRLQTWICRTDDLSAAQRAIPGVGDSIALSRGDLRWSMAVPQSGILPFDNRCPALIQWQGSAHPASRLEDSGCALRRLIVSHPQAAELQATLSGQLNDTRVVFETGMSSLRAEIDTPHGMRVLA
ncbi:MAG: VOC family protein [Rhodobacteraceae bacterium]|nr:VOC family protein [Paracoccaceae bacterium]